MEKLGKSTWSVGIALWIFCSTTFAQSLPEQESISEPVITAFDQESTQIFNDIRQACPSRWEDLNTDILATLADVDAEAFWSVENSLDEKDYTYFRARNADEIDTTSVSAPVFGDPDNPEAVTNSVAIDGVVAEVYHACVAQREKAPPEGFDALFSSMVFSLSNTEYQGVGPFPLIEVLFINIDSIH